MQFNCSILAQGLCDFANLTATTSTSASGGLAPTLHYRYAHWEIANCNIQRTQHIISSLDEISLNGPLILSEAARGTQSGPFTSFFKLTRMVPHVKGVFSDLLDGKPVVESKNGDNTTSGRPIFVCTDQEGTTDQWVQGCAKSGGWAGANLARGLIVLCPSFWENAYPAEGDTIKAPQCPNFALSSRLPIGTAMLASKTATILHELVHFYQGPQMSPEVYDMRVCGYLLPADSLRNAQNYAFFAMSQ